MASKRNFGQYKADLQKQESPYVFYGTALPPLDDQVRDDGSYVPVWKQEVVDERGRKRLHGAFTGGFSAGYFNTVGSKEGWTPSTFVSSRSNRMKDSKNVNQQRPEDFMDEEDLREAEESKKVTTNEEFSGFGSTEDDTKRKSAFLDLFRPTGETKGIQLLRRMGWREGQGIGPKIRRKVKTDEHDADEDYHLLPPENPPLISIVRKTDHKGLGHGGQARLESHLSTGPPRSTTRPYDEGSEEENGGLGPVFTASKSKKKVKDKRKSGFGVGILNDTGSDDEDPYEMGPKISYNRTIGGDKPVKKASLGGSNPLLKAKPAFVSKKTVAVKSSSGFRKCHDGRYPPEGFVLSSQLDSFASMAIGDESMKPPEVPKDWHSSKTPQQPETEPGYTSTADAARQSKMDAKGRAVLLGETQLPGKSVFDFLTPAARDRISQATGNTNLPAALAEKPPPGFETSEAEKQLHLESLVPDLDREVALQALNRGISGWMPYAEDLIKRSRYRTFLEIRAGLQQGLPERPTEMTKDAWIAEMNEFARAAQVFKPVTGLMASRFTSSTARTKDSTSPSTSSDQPLLQTPTQPQKPEDPAEQAAKLGMFGPMTRSITTFYPTRLLCKRFNVKPPANVSFDPDTVGGSGPTTSSTMNNSTANVPFPFPSASRFQSARFQTATNEPLTPGDESATAASKTEEAQRLSSSDDLASSNQDQLQQHTSPLVVDAETNEALEADRPGEAVFKAIFGSDDEDEE